MPMKLGYFNDICKMFVFVCLFFASDIGHGMDVDADVHKKETLSRYRQQAVQLLKVADWAQKMHSYSDLIHQSKIYKNPQIEQHNIDRLSDIIKAFYSCEEFVSPFEGFSIEEAYSHILSELKHADESGQHEGFLDLVYLLEECYINLKAVNLKEDDAKFIREFCGYAQWQRKQFAEATEKLAELKPKIDFAQASADISLLMDSFLGGMRVEQMTSLDNTGVNHYAHVFLPADSSKKPKRIFYYVRGGVRLNISDPNSYRFSPDFLENSVLKYHEILGVSHYVAIDRTLSAMPLINELVNSGYLVVCLNYPGAAIHGDNWNDPDYLEDPRIWRGSSDLTKVSSYKIDLEASLATIIKDQIIDLTPRIREKYTLSDVQMEFCGHSVGGGIGAALIANYREFLEEYFSSMVLFCPCILNNGVYPLNENTQSKWAEDFVEARNARIEALQQSEITLPVTIIAGELDQLCSPATEARLIHGALKKRPNVFYRELVGANHAPHNMVDLIPDFFNLVPKKESEIVAHITGEVCESSEEVQRAVEIIYQNETRALQVFQECIDLIRTASKRDIGSPFASAVAVESHLSAGS